jgi:hypothetical protein
VPRGTLAFTGPTSLAILMALRPHFCALTQPSPPSPDNSISSHFALLALAFNLHPNGIKLVDPTTGQALKAIHPGTGHKGALSEESCAKEEGHLANGYKQSTGTNTIRLIRHDHQVPKGHKATYLRNVVANQPQNTQTGQVRWTVGGNLIDYPGDVSTKMARLTTAKLLFNSVISTPNALFEHGYQGLLLEYHPKTTQVHDDSC